VLISLFLNRQSLDLLYDFYYEEIVTINYDDILTTVTPAGNHFRSTIFIFNFKLTLQSLVFTINMSVVTDDHMSVHNLLFFHNFFPQFFSP